MKMFRKRTFAFSLVILFLISFGCKKDNDDNSTPIPDPTKTEKVEQAIEIVKLALEDQLGYTVPSMSIYLQTTDDVIFATSVTEGAEVPTAKSCFRFASNTKTFTSTAILNMQEDGWLDITDKMLDIVPGYDISYVPLTDNWNIPYKEYITIEQLLQHAAGVYDVDNDTVPNCDGKSYVEYVFSGNPNHQFTVEELVGQNAMYHLSYFSPGEGYHYSNTGYNILSYVVANVYSLHSGYEKTFEDYLYDYVYGDGAPVPLTLGFPEEATDIYLPEPHITGQIVTPLGIETFDASNMSAHVGEGNGCANFEDLNKFVRTLMKGENVLNAETIQLMQTDHSLANEGYGLGCIHATNLGYGHNGCIRGYLSLMLYDPEYDVSLIVCLPSVDMTRMDNFVANFMSMYYAAYDAREVLGFPGNPDVKTQTVYK
jgi:D-alanyl-D-alanine carboxypeptidase